MIFGCLHFSISVLPMFFVSLNLRHIFALFVKWKVEIKVFFCCKKKCQRRKSIEELLHVNAGEIAKIQRNIPCKVHERYYKTMRREYQPKIGHRWIGVGGRGEKVAYSMYAYLTMAIKKWLKCFMAKHCVTFCVSLCFSVRCYLVEPNVLLLSVFLTLP